MKNYQNFIIEVNRYREQKLNYLYGERNKPENYLPKDPVKDALKNKKLVQGNALTPQVAQLAPPKVDTPIDTRSPGKRLYDLMMKAREKKET